MILSYCTGFSFVRIAVTYAISFIFDLRNMVLSFYIGFSFIRIAVTCAILERISGFEPSSEMIAARYLKLMIIPSFYPFTLISLAAIGTVCHQFGLLLSAFYNLCKFSG